MRMTASWLALMLIAAAPASAQEPAAQLPPVPAPVIPVTPSVARVFTGNSGVIFTSVRPERVRDFETVIAYLQEAQRTATDPAVRQQAQGWRVFKASEPGPNTSVVYVFLIDPVVQGADYSLGPILAAAYPDKIQELWKLYQSAIIQQSILNLNPVAPASPAAEGTTPAR